MSEPSDPATPTLLGRTLGGRYCLRAAIGEGGMDTVYAALQEDLQRRVAIKVLHATAREPAELERFRREALASAALGHPNISWACLPRV